MNRCVTALLLLVSLTACNRDPNAAKKKYVENGNKYFKREKYKEALIMYRNALKRDLKYGEAYYRSALAELKLKRWGEAARSLQRAVELQPHNLDAHVQLANLFLNAYLGDKRRPKPVLDELKSIAARMEKRFPDGYDTERVKGYLALFDNDSESALNHFAKANRLKPYQQDLVLVYMQTLVASGQNEAAEKLALDVIRKDPAALGVYDALYLQYARTNRPADAEKILRAKVDRNPKRPDGYLQLAAHYYSLKQRPEMLSMLNRMAANKTDFPNAPLLIGDFYLRARELDHALEQYELGVRQGGKDKNVYQKRIAELLVKQDKKDQAQKVIQDVLKEDPKDSEAIAMRASLSMLTGTKEELQSAINDLHTVVSRMPENHVLRFNLGRALAAKGDTAAARVQFEEAIKLRPDYLLPRITLAQMMLQNRDYGKAITMAQEILVYDPGNVPARLLRSRALIAMGDFKQAREELKQTSIQHPDLPEARLQIAALDLQDRSFKDAEDGFRKLYSQSQDPRAFMGLVETYVAQNQVPTALKMLREELSKDPERVDIRVAIANISASIKDFPTAIAEYRKALEKVPRSSDVWMRLGETYRLAGDLNAAAASFKKAQEVVPNNPLPYVRLALLHEQTGQKADAKPLYEQILRMEPNNHIALNNLAYMLADSGADLDQALTMVQRAKQQQPTDPNIADTLGWIYIKKNLADSAIGVLKDLVEKEPDRATYRYHLAVALAQKGDKAQARKECEAALRSKPDKDEEAKIRELISKLS